MSSALGDTLHCVDAQTEEPVWTKKLHENKEQDELLDSVLTPPALVNDKVFVGTILGEVYCLSALSGTAIWCANIVAVGSETENRFAEEMFSVVASWNG